MGVKLKEGDNNVLTGEPSSNSTQSFPSPCGFAAENNISALLTSSTLLHLQERA